MAAQLDPRRAAALRTAKILGFVAVSVFVLFILKATGLG
jgi:hypothetical protein